MDVKELITTIGMVVTMFISGYALYKAFKITPKEIKSVDADLSTKYQGLAERSLIRANAAEAKIDVIEKWEFINQLFDDNPDTKIHTNGTATCAFCVAYYEIDGCEFCSNCPIRIRTGRPFCERTPYRDNVTQQVAQTELRFLLNLRKEVESEEVEE